MKRIIAKFFIRRTEPSLSETGFSRSISATGTSSVQI